MPNTSYPNIPAQMGAPTRGPALPSFAMRQARSSAPAMVPYSSTGEQTTCTFPKPPLPRVYCQPSAFSSTDGRSHHLLLYAYGNSAPSTTYM